MAVVEVKVPVFSESVTEGRILTWHKKPGEAVKRDDHLLDIETDKVVLEVNAQQDGVLVSIARGEGETVTSQELVGTIDTAAAPAAAAAEQAPAAATAAATPATAP